MCERETEGEREREGEREIERGCRASVLGQVDVYSSTALAHAAEERSDGDVQDAPPHHLDPVHVDEEELHTGHDQPGHSGEERRGEERCV